MKVFKDEFKIKAPIAKVWDSLVNPRTINKWGAGPSKMKSKTGFKFSLWGGDIHGVNTKVLKEKELTQDWMAGKWEKYSSVSFKLKEKSGTTHVTLVHKGIPISEYKDIEEGWRHSFFAEIKNLLEAKENV